MHLAPLNLALTALQGLPVLAAHPVVCTENTENSLELWPVVNWPDKTGLVQLLVYPFLFSKWGQPQGEQVSSLISHAHCPAFLQAKVKDQAVSHLPETFMRQGGKPTRQAITLSLICLPGGEGIWEADTPVSMGMLTPQCLQRKLQSIDACNSKWGFSSGLQHQELQGIV